MKTYSGNFAITGTSVPLVFPTGTYFIVDPAVIITVEGAPTDVSVTRNKSNVNGVGQATTGVTIGFAAGAVGKRFSIIVNGE